MAVRSIKKIPVFVWIPPTYDAEIKIIVVRSDGTEDDITDFIVEGELTDGATETVGNFSFLVDNSSESRTGIWTGNEIIYIYSDYDLTATTKRFRGRIEKVSYQNNKIKITGRSESYKLLDLTVTKSYENTETSAILIDLFNNYATDFIQSGISASTTNITVNWVQKPFLECVQELCSNANFDFYIDSNLIAHYFESKTINNETEAVVHDMNIFETGDFSEDLSLIRNRIIVYGANVGGLPLFKTAEDLDSQTTHGIKELIINDTNITTEEQCQERANYELEINKGAPLNGEVVCKLLATIQPGEMVRISDPPNNLQPKYYKIISYRHNLIDRSTTLNIEKESKKISRVLGSRISQEQKLSDMENTINTTSPVEMRCSILYDFSENVGSHTNTVINTTAKVLKTDGSTSGTWISPLVNSYNGENITGIEVRVNGNNLVTTGNVTTIKVFLSLDGGLTFYQSLLPSGSTISIPQGNSVIAKVVFSSSSAELKGLGVYYKTD